MPHTYTLKATPGAGNETYMASYSADADGAPLTVVNFDNQGNSTMGQLATGTYDLFWGMFGTPGSKLTLAIVDETGASIKTFTDTINPGNSTKSNGGVFTIKQS
jgi:hypothetical protein